MPRQKFADLVAATTSAETRARAKARATDRDRQTLCRILRRLAARRHSTFAAYAEIDADELTQRMLDVIYGKLVRVRLQPDRDIGRAMIAAMRLNGRI